MFKKELVQKLRVAYDMLQGAITEFVAPICRLKLMFLPVATGYVAVD